MSKQFWLTFNNGKEKLRFPVNPETFEVGNGSQTVTYSVNGIGEISIISDAVLKTFTFASQFPAHWGPFCEYLDIPNPVAAVTLISKWKASKKPLRLTVTESPWNFPVTVEDFNYKEEGGDVDTLYFDISLKEYKFIKQRKVNQSKDKKTGKTTAKVSSTSARPSAKVTPKTYKVVKGDTLAKIGKKYGKTYQTLADLNKIKPPYALKVGQVIKLS